MEILTLLLLYLIAQDPDFPERVKPIMGNLKNSETVLNFLNELSRFSDLFSAARNKSPSQGKSDEKKPENHSDEKKNDANEKKEEQKEKHPQSPTSGIADEFIQQCLEKYFKNRQ